MVLDPAVVTPKRGYGRDFFGAELNVHSVQVGLLPLRLGGARYGNDATGVVPGERGFAAADAVALANLNQGRFFDQAAAIAQRTPRFGDNAAGIVLFHQLLLREVGVQLNLVHCGQLAGFFL